MTSAPAGGSIPAPGAHGGDADRIAAALGIDPATMLDLSQTLNPCAPDVGELVRSRLDAIRRYPDPTAATGLLAETMGVDPARLLLTNGGSEAITLVAAELGGGTAREPEFGLHPRARSGPRWRSNPNNPTGVLAAPDAQADVWDEAFHGLATGRWTSGHGGVIVGSLTKTFACPGLRLGYVIADDVDRFARRQPEWSVSTLALAIVPDLLARCDLPGWSARIADLRSQLIAVFASRGYDVDQTEAPWVLVRSAGLRDRLAERGIVVRDCTSFGMAGVTRVAVPDERGLHRLATALDRMGTGSG